MGSFSLKNFWNHAIRPILSDSVRVGSLGLIPMLLHQKPKPLAPNYNQPTAPQMFRAEVTSQKIIYGQMRVSGPLYRVGSTGRNHMYSHIIIPLAGHELDSIGNIIVNTKLVNGTAVLPQSPTPLQQWQYNQDVLHLKQYKNHVRVSRHLGGAGQVVDPDLLAEFPAWKSTSVGNGIAYVYIRFKYSAALFPNGISNVQVDVRGKKVFDPRNQSIAWSDNWALCMRDYLTADYGMGLTDAEINDTYTIASANISQEVIPTANGGSQNRYTLNGVVDTKNKVTDNITKMLTAGAGHIVPVLEGQCRIIAGSFPAAADINITLTESDVISDINYQPHAPRNSLFNTVTGSYAGEESNWKKLTYPQVGDAAAILADGRVIRKVIDLPYCTDHERCQRLSKLVLNQHRASAVLKVSCKATMKEVAAMEVINVQMPALWAGTRTFRVADITTKADFTVDMVLHEDNAAIYAWQQSDAAVFVPVPPTATSTGATVVQPGIPIRVNGLELAGQGHNTEFTGEDAHFVWRHTTSFDFQAIGSEIFGAGSGGFDAWFMGYDIRILDPNGNVLRTDFTKDNFYDFTYLKNAYSRGGPFRSFSIEVRIKGQQNQLSQPATLRVSNPAPALPLAVELAPTFTTIFMTYTAPSDPDFAGVMVYLSTISGFVPDATTLVYDGPDTTPSFGGLSAGAAYFVRFATYDMFGKTGLNMSSEYAVSTLLVDAQTIANNVVSTQHLVNGSVTATKIGLLAVGTSAIQLAAITTALISDASIVNAKIATAAVSRAKIQDLAVDQAKIANAAITSAKIANAAITSAKIANAAITDAHITSLHVDKITGDVNKVAAVGLYPNQTITASAPNYDYVASITLPAPTHPAGHTAVVSLVANFSATAVVAARVEVRVGTSVIASSELGSSTKLSLPCNGVYGVTTSALTFDVYARRSPGNGVATLVTLAGTIMGVR